MLSRILCVALTAGLIGACGEEPKEPKVIQVPGPAPTPTPTPGPREDTWATMQPIAQKHCALSGCHGPSTGFVQNKQDFLSPRVRSVIAGGSMPKQSSPIYSEWTDALKARVLRYIDNNN